MTSKSLNPHTKTVSVSELRPGDVIVNPFFGFSVVLSVDLIEEWFINVVQYASNPTWVKSKSIIKNCCMSTELIEILDDAKKV